MVVSGNLKVSNNRPFVWCTRLVFKHLTIKRRAKVTSTINSHCVRIIICHNLRSAGTSVVSPCHPHFASDNRSSSIDQCSWEGGEGSPGCCSREEGQHRRKVVVGSISVSSDNHKCLQRFKMWVGLVSPQWEEQHRHDHVCPPAVGGAPRQSR